MLMERRVLFFVLVVVVTINKDGRHAPLPPTVQK